MTEWRVISFKISRDLLERLDSYARLKNLPRSEVIRKAIELYLRWEDKKTVPQPKVVKLTS